MLAADVDRWRLVERSFFWWMCVVSWAEKKTAWRPSLIQTCCVCSLLWSNCTLGSRWSSCVNVKNCPLTVLIQILRSLFCFLPGDGCGFRGFGKLWWTGLHRGYWAAWNTSRCTGEAKLKKIKNQQYFYFFFMQFWSLLVFSLLGVEYMGRYHKYFVSGCSALCGS